VRCVGADGSLDLLDHLPEPVPLFSQRYGLPCPLVPFTKQQVRAVNSPLFLRLLKAVGLQVPTAESVYPLVPTTLPAAYLFSVAQRLAPLDTASLKFDPALLEKMVPQPETVADAQQQQQSVTMTESMVDDLPPPPPPLLAPLRTSNWMTLISRQKARVPVLNPGYAMLYWRARLKDTRCCVSSWPDNMYQPL